MNFFSKIFQIKAKTVSKKEFELDVKDFESIESLWSFITSEEKWYNIYSPYDIKNLHKKLDKLEPLIITTTNNLRREMNFSSEDYWNIVVWDQYIVRPNLDNRNNKDISFKQYCSNCFKESDFTDRYPKSICYECTSKITDINGRKVEFFNKEALGFGCQGYYSGTKQSEEYDSNECYINNKKFIAKEARFGGIIIELED